MKTIVIGGGLIGLSTAQALISRGEDVQVLESREGVALETSFANGGLHTPSMSEPWNAPGVYKHLAESLFDPYSSMKLRLSAVPSLTFWGLKFLRNSTAGRFYANCAHNYALASYSLRKTLQITDDRQLQYDFGRGGTLSVFHDQRSLQAQTLVAETLAASGMRYHSLSAEEVVEREPTLAPIRAQIEAGIMYPDDVRGDAHLFCHELRRVIEEDGGSIATGVKVHRLLRSNGKITGVQTDNGAVHAERVIVAAGVASPALLKSAGESVSVKPAKGYSVTIDAGGMSGVPTIPVQDDSLHAAVVPIGSRLRLVGTAEFAGFDRRIEQVRVDNLFRLLETLLPELDKQVDRDAAEAWTNLRPMSSDGRPFIGAASTAGLYINTGHGPLGWTQAMGSANLLADLIVGRDTDIDPSPFAAQR